MHKPQFLTAKKDLSPEDYKTLINNLTFDCFNRGSFAGVIFGLLNFYYIFSDWKAGRFDGVYGGWDLAALLMLVIPSLITFVLGRIYIAKKMNNIALARITMLFFSLSLIFSITVISFISNYDIKVSNTTTDITGIPLSTCYFVTFLLMPLPKISDSAILIIATFFSGIILLFLPGGEVVNSFKQLSFRLLICIGYLLVLNMNYRSGITSLRANQMSEKLRKLAITDTLTGVYNRNKLNSNIKEIKNFKSLHVLMIDIDFFKTFNDNYSHIQGDHIIEDVANTIKNQELRDKFEIYRFGGDEFVVTIKDCETSTAIEISKSILKKVNKLNEVYPEIKSLISVTIGLSYIADPSKIDNLDTLIKEADEQLYIGKKDGGNCLVFEKKVIE